MPQTNDRKKFDSDICIDGKRIGTMRQIAKATFRDSFLSIEVRMPDRIFIVRLDDRAPSGELKEFTSKHRLCRIILYKEIDLSALMNASRK